MIYETKAFYIKELSPHMELVWAKWMDRAVGIITAYFESQIQSELILDDRIKDRLFAPYIAKAVEIKWDEMTRRN